MTDSNIGKQLTIIIPAFNEEQSIGQVIEGIVTSCREIVEEIIVVDDGSWDETARIAEKAGARVIRHSRNKGYGTALKTGIRGANTEFVLTMDADGQHRAENVLRLWELADANDMVVGARTNLIHSSLWRMPGKWLLGLVTNYLTHYSIPDLNSGFRIIRGDTASKYLHLCPSGFSFSTTITMTLISRGYDVAYVPIQVEQRVGKSTVSIATGLETIILILRIATLFDPLRIFVPISLIIALIGFLWGIPYVITGRGVSVGSLMAIVTAILLFAIGLLSDQISQLRLERFE